jgi:hypothetical protein
MSLVALHMSILKNQRETKWNQNLFGACLLDMMIDQKDINVSIL